MRKTRPVVRGLVNQRDVIEQRIDIEADHLFRVDKL